MGDELPQARIVLHVPRARVAVAEDLSRNPAHMAGASQKFTKPALLLVAALLFLVGLRFFNLTEWARLALNWMRSLGALGPLAFVGFYIAACLTFFPGVLLTLGAGILYGLFWGSIYVSIGATLGASAAFLVARYAAREWMKARIGHHPKFQAID